MMFFFCSANLTDYFFAAESEEIGFFPAESEDILFLQFQFNRLFLLFAKWVKSEQKVNMFFFSSVKLTDYFFSLQSEQKVNRK